MRFDGLIPGYQVDVNVNEKDAYKALYWDFGRIVDGVKQLTHTYIMGVSY